MTSAAASGRSSSAPTRSEACPPVRVEPARLPSASTVAWILVLNRRHCAPEHLTDPFPRASAVLVLTKDGVVDHGVLIISIGTERGEGLRPHAALCPAAEPREGVFPAAQAHGQVAPGMIARQWYKTASMNRQLSRAVPPTSPTRPRAAARSAPTGRSAHDRAVAALPPEVPSRPPRRRKRLCRHPASNASSVIRHGLQGRAPGGEGIVPG